MENTEYKGYTIEIKQDELGDSPREWDNLGIMICKHRNYNLGDENQTIPDYYYTYKNGQEIENYIDSWNDVMTWIKKYNDVAIILPLGLYDHSGITMYVGNNHDTFDGGQVGFIYVTKETLRKEYNVKRITKSILQKAENVLRGEVETYDQYLTGDVWYFNVTDENGEEIDSCGGFYGYDYCLKESQGIVDWYIEDTRKKKQAKLKSQIKSGVPIVYR